MVRRARVLTSPLVNLVILIYCYEISLKFERTSAKFGEQFYANILNIKSLIKNVKISQLLFNENFRVIKAAKFLQIYFVNFYNNFCLEKVKAIPTLKSFFVIEINKKLIPWLKWNSFDYYWKKNKFQSNIIPYDSFAFRIDFETFFFLREIRCVSTKSVKYNEYLASLHIKKAIGNFCKPACKDLDDYLRNFYIQILRKGIYLFEFDSFLTEPAMFSSQNVLEILKRDKNIAEINKWDSMFWNLNIGFCLMETSFFSFNLYYIWKHYFEFDYGVYLLLYKYKTPIEYDEIGLKLQFFSLEVDHFMLNHNMLFFVDLCKKILQNNFLLNFYFNFDFYNYFSYDYFFYKTLIKNSIIFFSMGNFILGEINSELLSKLNNSMFSKGISSYWYSLVGLFCIFHVYNIEFFLEVFVFGIEYYFLRIVHCDYESRFGLIEIITQISFDTIQKERVTSAMESIYHCLNKTLIKNSILQTNELILIKCFQSLQLQVVNSSVPLLFLLENLFSNNFHWNHFSLFTLSKKYTLDLYTKELHSFITFV